MFREKNSRYISWGLTAFAVITAALFISYVINSFSAVSKALNSIVGILMPIIYGLVMAFLMAPMYNRIVDGLSSFFCLKKKHGNGEKRNLHSFAESLIHAAATTLCLVLILAVVAALLGMIIPQLIVGIRQIINSMPNGATSAAAVIEAFFHGEHAELEATVLQLYDQLYSTVNSWISAEFLPNINTYITTMTSGVFKIVIFLKNFFIGLIVMAYVLNMKEMFATQTKKIVYAVFPVRIANEITEETRYVKDVFSKFIVGKIIDSILIGIICYVCMSFMKMPYTLLISVVVGVTNVIPFFGPFIGAIPSALILLLTSPVVLLQFLVFILILQQFDGNILGPRILGSATGVSSFWVLFSILFFGGLWGIVGMVIGIPTFAVTARLFRRFIEHLLRKKALSDKTEDYDALERIDTDSLKYYYQNDAGKSAAGQESSLQSETK